MFKCFLCDKGRNEQRISDAKAWFKLNLTTAENENVLRILCQLLRLSWDVFDAYVPTNLPFCTDCAASVMGLIDLREQLLKLETEMMNRIRELEITVASTTYNDLFLEDDNTRNIFRQQVLEEHHTKELLRQKILELKMKVHNTDVKTESERHVGIQVEPAFVQLHLGLRLAPLTSTPHELSKPEEDTFEKEYDSIENSNWINTQKGPLTRLRLSNAIPPFQQQSKKGEENMESLTSNDSDFESHCKEDYYCSDNSSGSNYVAENLIDIKVRRRTKTVYRNKKSSSKSTNSKALGKNVQRLRNKNRKRTNSSSIQRWPAEEFNEIKVEEDGRRFYEGIEIISSPGDSVRGEFVLQCGSCSKEIDKSNALSYKRCAFRLMQMHIKAYHLDAYKCQECGKALHDHRRLILHMRVQHPPGGKPVKNRRARVFGNQKIPPELDVSENGTVTFEEIPIVRMDTEDYDFNLHCGICPKVFSKSVAHKTKQCPYRQMIKHLKAVHLKSYSCKLCEKSFRCEKSLKQHSDKTHSDNPLEVYCEICGRPVSGEAYLRKHMFTHKNEDEKEGARAAGEQGPRTYRELMEKRKAMGLGASYQCSQCGKTFHFGANLRRHEFVHRKEIRDHKCPQCGKLYNTAENLKSHIKYIHETERVHKKYRCNYCPKWFVTKSPWEKHERTHTKDIPYHCPTCNKGFALKQSMTNHVKSQKCMTVNHAHLTTKFHSPSQHKKARKGIEVSHDNTSPRQSIDSELKDQMNNLTGPNVQSIQTHLDMPLSTITHRTTIPLPFPFPNYPGHFGQNCGQPQFNNF